MMKWRRFYLVTGVSAYLLFLVAQLPAYWLYRQLLPAGEAQLQGSLWHGYAQNLTLAGLKLDAAQWDWQSRALLSGQVAYQLQLSAPELRLSTTLALSPSGWQAQTLQGELTLAPLTQRTGLLLSGQLQLQLAQVRWQTQPWQLQAAHGQVRVRNLKLNLGATPLLLGDISAHVQADQLPATFKLSSEGALNLSGEWILSAENRYQLRARLSPKPETDTSTRQQLQNWLGPLPSEGFWLLNFAGSLPL